MALAIKPLLLPLTTFAEVVHFITTDANGVEVDYTDTFNPPQCFLRWTTDRPPARRTRHSIVRCRTWVLGNEF